MTDTPKVSVVITSFNRLDLLKRTIESFNMFNTYPIEKFIVIEDSADRDMMNNTIEFLESLPTGFGSKVKKYLYMFNEKNIGQIDTIDLAYSRVETPYVFHSEDDYEYFRHGFIEKSIAVMEHNPKIMQVWIRKTSDVMGQPILPQIYDINDKRISYQIIGEHQEWYGFCFQCGLRRMDIYKQVAPYFQWSPDTDFTSQRECKIGIALWKLGYKAAILPEGYARHTGQFRSVSGNQLK